MNNNDIKKDPSFFSNVYTYFIRGGYSCILVDNISNIIITGATLIFFTFVCFFLDWKKIGECDSEITCNSISDYIISPVNHYSISTNIFMFVFIITVFIYWLWISIALVGEIFRYVKYREYFRDNLGIRTNELKVLSWNDIIKKMIASNDDLTTEIIVGSIMKKDNYLIAMINTNIFRINPILYTNSFMWLMNIGVLNQIFSDNNIELKLTDVDYTRIKRILRILGIIQLVLLPFTIVIMMVHYLISFTTDIYTKKSYIGPKEWTVYAKLLFREYNELPHIFNDRISRSYKYAVQYEQKFNAHMVNIIMEKVIYILGTYLTLLVIMTFYDERLLMYIRLFNRNLLWYVAILTSAISIARLMMVSPSTIDESSEEIMSKMAKYTHYYPKKWKDRCHKHAVLEEFQKLFKYKIFSVLLEMMSMIVMPFYMLFKLPHDIELVAKFIQRRTIFNDKIGHVCRYSNIDEETGNFNQNINDNDSSDSNESGESNYKPLIEIDDDKVERSNRNFMSYYSVCSE